MKGYGLKASQVVAMARRYKDYQEKSRLGTRTQMWDLHWSAGYNNYTIWAILYKDYTARNYQAQPWCAMYGADIMVLALQEHCGMDVPAAAEAAKDLFGGDLPYNCQLFVDQHRKDTRLDHTPAAGAMVIFWTGSKYGHWGICSGVDKIGKGFTSVEGNTSGGADKVDPDGGAVVEKWHSLAAQTLFWHPQYTPEAAASGLEPDRYAISVGKDGLIVTAQSLYIREQPGDGRKVGTLKAGDRVWPQEKCFIDGKAWYKIPEGWISSRYLEGWVKEDNGLWWYVMQGYTFSVGAWQQIAGKWYYFDNIGYMATSRWILDAGRYYYVTSSGEMAKDAYVKSIEKELYYWVNAEGVWEPEWDTEAPDLNRYQLIR